MPVCKNNPKRNYKGTEPSPKGLGWCASGEKIGKKRKGKDGNIWIIKKVSNGSKRWMKDSKTETKTETKTSTKKKKVTKKKNVTRKPKTKTSKKRMSKVHLWAHKRPWKVTYRDKNGEKIVKILKNGTKKNALLKQIKKDNLHIYGVNNLTDRQIVIYKNRGCLE